MLSTELVLGHIFDYKWDDIEPFYYTLRKYNKNCRVVLLSMTPFDGVYASDVEIIQVKHIPFLHPMVQRFKDFYEYLSRDGITSKVILSDIGDVIFQSDPFEDFPAVVNVDTEGLTYNQEPWSNRNMLDCYGPEVLSQMNDKTIKCAGVIMGAPMPVRNAVCNIFMKSLNAFTQFPTSGGGPDQAALNLLNIGVSYGRVVHMGGTVPAIMSGAGEVGYQYIKGFIEMPLNSIQSSIVERDGKLVVVNDRGQEYSIVHQYNRVPQLKEQYRNRERLYSI